VLSISVVFLFLGLAVLAFFQFRLFKLIRKVGPDANKHSFSIEHASNLYKCGEFTELKDYCAECLVLSPNDDHLHWYIAIGNYAAGDLLLSKQAFLKAISINPNLKREAQAYLEEITLQEVEIKKYNH